jgi:hypothetical protein
MLDAKSYPFCDEFYIVEKSIEVEVKLARETRRVRIDALRDHAGQYSTHAYIKEDITVQPPYPQKDGGNERERKSVSVWIDYDLPWTNRHMADEALSQALGFLRERCPK